ncbi:DUF3078 domain-containing protein [Bacteroidetes/Chlorobi group bacterium Naka2016]|jgi:hypothetical protein|nr:MAG: DUF3078 domain-containing protein [Bacteroidetes/Chlorobi group bacterium Naka2016]
MKFKLILVIFYLIGCSLFSQVKEVETIVKSKPKADTIGWKKGGLLSINLAQTSLTNWAAGGQNSISIQGLLSLFSSHKWKISYWDNYLDIGYGLLQQGENKKFIKTDDKFELTSKYGLQFQKNFFMAFALNFRTQLTVGWNYGKDTQKISNFLAPAYLITALGIDWKPLTDISVFAAPITGRLTYVNDEELANKGSFGVKPAVYDSLGNIIEKSNKTKKEFGGFLRIYFSKSDFNWEVLKNISITSKLDLFSDYLNKPQNIDVNWENIIFFKVNKIISINLSTQLIYDENVKIPIDSHGDGKFDSFAPRTQFKEIFGLGISLSF